MSVVSGDSYALIDMLFKLWSQFVCLSKIYVYMFVFEIRIKRNRKVYFLSNFNRMCYKIRIIK